MLCHKVESSLDDELWAMILENEGKEFTTLRGLPFTYEIKKNSKSEQLGEIVISRKTKTITRATVLLAYNNAHTIMCDEGFVKEPKKLNVFGASYLYPIFIKLGLIKGKESFPQKTEG